MLIVYRDQDQEWWVENEADTPKKYGALENLPNDLVDKIVALQHVSPRTRLDGIGVRVGEARYWLDEGL